MRSGFGKILAILKTSRSSWILQSPTLQRLPSAFLSPLSNSLSPLSVPKKENKIPHHHHRALIVPPPIARSRFCSLHTMAESSTSIYDITVKDASGNDVNLGIYRGKVLLIVNVASQCGLTTTNYTELTDIYNKYKDQGLEVLAFPCNQFAGQEPGSNEQIKEFVCTRFKAEYPIFGKVDVNGSNTAPIYKYLKSAKLGGIFGDFIKWNFTKFLVNKEGQVVNRFAPTTSPSKIEKDVKKLVEGN